MLEQNLKNPAILKNLKIHFLNQPDFKMFFNYARQPVYPFSKTR